MGFLLFDESGVFNPAEHGLSAGDTLTVVCVGGGGGGSCHNTLEVGEGGTGGASSFGEYVTALGGSGGKGINADQQGKQGTYRGGVYNQYGAGGAGGWLPGFPLSSGHCTQTWAQWVDGDCGVVRMPSSMAGLNGTVSASMGSYYQQTASTAWNVVYRSGVKVDVPENALDMYLPQVGARRHPVQNTEWNPFVSVGRSNYPNRHSISGGNSGTHGTTDANSNYSMSLFPPLGGIGYGAGGASAGFLNHGPGTNMNSGGTGGNSGEIILRTVSLANTGPIAVNVGGGGAGGYGCYYTYNGQVTKDVGKGNDGGPGTYGASVNENYVGRGGYGKIPGGCGVTTKSVSIANPTGAAGGAGGCVAIWW